MSTRKRYASPNLRAIRREDLGPIFIESEVLPNVFVEDTGACRKTLLCERPHGTLSKLESFSGAGAGNLRIVVYFLLDDLMRATFITASQAEWIGAWITQEIRCGAVARRPILEAEEPIDLMVTSTGTVLFVGEAEVNLGRYPKAKEWFRVAREVREGKGST